MSWLRIAVGALAHIVAAFVAGSAVLDVNLIPCAVPGDPPHRLRAVLLLGLVGATGPVLWGYLAARGRRPLLLLIGCIIGAPVGWLAAQILLAPAAQFCP